MKEESEQTPTEQSSQSISVLDTAMTGMQSSVANMYSTLSKTLEQSLNMTHMVNSMLEHVLKTGVRITSRLVHDQGTLLTVTISNTTQFPLLNTEAHLAFTPLGSEKSEPVPVTYHVQSASQTNMDAEHTEDGPRFFENGTRAMLTPRTSHTERLRLTMPQLLQCNGKISVRFSSPGGSDSITVNHTFGIYLVDQLTKRWCAESDAPREGGVEYDMDTALFRDIMQLPPTAGVDRGHCVHLFYNPTDGDDMQATPLFVCLVDDILQEGQRVRTRLYETNHETSLLNQLIAELNILQ